MAAVRTEAARTALLRAALGSVADRAIIPMADWLGLGEEAHLNSPGKLGGNWSWRAAEGSTLPRGKRISGGVRPCTAVHNRAGNPECV